MTTKAKFRIRKDENTSIYNDYYYIEYLEYGKWHTVPESGRRYLQCCKDNIVDYIKEQERLAKEYIYYNDKGEQV